MRPFDHLRVKEEPVNINPAFVDYDPAEETIKETGADIRFGGDHALFNRRDDYILCPPKHRFKEERPILRDDLSTNWPIGPATKAV